MPEKPRLTLGTIVRFTGQTRELAGDGKWVCSKLPQLPGAPLVAQFVRLGGGDNMLWTVTLDNIEILTDDDSADRLQELQQRLGQGWVPFGWHVDYHPVPDLEFSDEVGEDGMPLWERVPRA